MDENTITLNQYNILGQKIDVDINKIRNNEKLEYVILKNFNVTNEIMVILETLKNLVEAPYQNYDIILFDRGALDEKFWINFDACNGDFDDRIIYLSKLFDDVLPDLLIVLKVSVDESLRRRGGEGHVVTREFLERYNALLNHFVNSLKINKDIVCTDNMKVEEVLNVVVNSILENLNKPS